MNVLMVCAEFAPWAKTGGLGDAVTGLSNALADLGHDVRVLLPCYAHLRSPGTALRALPAGQFRFAALEMATTDRAGPRVYLLDLGELTADALYTGDARDAGRFMRLALAALELPRVLGWQPDVLHCHDWHAALTPALQRAADGARAVRTVLTLHNVGYQGVFSTDVLEQYGLPVELRAAIAPEAPSGGNVNFLRAGVQAADMITTVSPTYAGEIRTPAFGMGLEDLLQARGTTLVGILNGVDYDVWDPRTDPFLATHYDASDLAPKRALKSALAERMGLEADASSPLFGIVTRLASQKGIDLVTAILPTLLHETRATFAVLGSGDAVLAGELTRFAREQPRRIAFTDGYDEALAHLILAGSDLTLVPSRYEPCGLTQMYALRYGTIPVVRATGGLADTIEHFDAVRGTGNGSVFRDADPQGLLWGVRTALRWYADPLAWSRLTGNAMAADFSWRNQVLRYEALYRSLVQDRAPPSATPAPG